MNIEEINKKLENWSSLTPQECFELEEFFAKLGSEVNSEKGEQD